MKIKWPWTRAPKVGAPKSEETEPSPKPETAVRATEPKSQPIQPARTALAEVLPSHLAELREGNEALKQAVAKRGVRLEEVEGEFTQLVHRARKAAFREVIQKGQTE